jgi:hypothetical protein
MAELDPDNTFFHAYFNNGFALRNLIQAFAQESGPLLILLEPHQMSFHIQACMEESATERHQSIYRFEIKTECVMDYYYNVRGADQEIVPQFPIHLNVTALHERTKELNKSAGIKLTWRRSMPNFMGVTVINAGMPNETLPLPLDYSSPAQIIIGDAYDAAPNVKVVFQEFHNWVDTAKKNCKEMRIIGRQDSMTIQLLDATRTIIGDKTFGSITSNRRREGSFNGPIASPTLTRTNGAIGSVGSNTSTGENGYNSSTPEPSIFASPSLTMPALVSASPALSSVSPNLGSSSVSPSPLTVIPSTEANSPLMNGWGNNGMNGPSPTVGPRIKIVDPYILVDISIPSRYGIFNALMKLAVEKNDVIRFYFKRGEPLRVDVCNGQHGTLSLKHHKVDTTQN